MIASFANAMPTASHRACAPGAAALPLNPASRCAAEALTSAAPPTGPAVPRPDSKERHTPAVTRSSAAAPTAPATGGGGGNGATQGSAHPVAVAGRKTTAPSASHAAWQGARSTAGAMPRAKPPVALDRDGSVRAPESVLPDDAEGRLELVRAGAGPGRVGAFGQSLEAQGPVSIRSCPQPTRPFHDGPRSQLRDLG